MKIAILGAGLTGLTAAHYLAEKGHQISIFEKEAAVGGLAVGFKEKDWEWTLEKHYHHFFTNDHELIGLVKKLGLSQNIIYPKSLTSVLFTGKIYPFNNAENILGFSPLGFINRLRLGIVIVLLKTLPSWLGIRLENLTAVFFAQKLFGKEVFNVVWKPLLSSKFNNYDHAVNASWLWARIKKRTLKLGYLKGGFQMLAEALSAKIQKQEVKLFLNSEISDVVKQENNFRINLVNKKASCLFDCVLSTLPTPVFLKLFNRLPPNLSNNLKSIPHLHALNLVLETKEPLLSKTYWLNINENDFPFLCAVQHTNFIDKKYYNNHHVLYISNYLPYNHPYFRKSPEELLNIYLPYLQKINPNFKLAKNGQEFKIYNLKLFAGLFAQPVFLRNYSKIRPYFSTPVENLYFANLDCVYPWDRGTNYAVELGRKAAELITNPRKI
jgi:protoporphyrinogen oxidase